MVFTHIKSLSVGRWLTGLLVMLFLGFAWPVWAKDQAIPKLDNWVVDTTATFNSAQKKALSDRLEAF